MAKLTPEQAEAIRLYADRVASAAGGPTGSDSERWAHILKDALCNEIYNLDKMDTSGWWGWS